MKLDHVVQVRACGGAAADGSFGTGCLVGPGLVLTAAHLIRTESGLRTSLTVFFPTADEPGPWEARLLWLRYDDIVDAALLSLTGSSGPGAGGIEPQRWGDLVTTTSAHPVEAFGYPRSQHITWAPGGSRGRFRAEEHLDGRISPATGRSARHWELLSNDPVPAGEGPGWAGMSGAPVFSGDLLLGVVRRDRRATAGARLTATRAGELLKDESFRVALSAASGGHEPVAEPAELTSLLDPAAPERNVRSPAMLLRADVEAAPFRGRGSEIRQLLDWCVGQSPQVRGGNLAVRVLTGPGGQGKSRMARQVVGAVRREHSWVSGLLRADLGDEAWYGNGLSSVTDESLRAFGACARNLLLVVDYAETRPRWIRHLIDRLRDVAKAGHTVRLLLVARSSGGWQLDPYEAGHVAHEILALAPTTELGPLDVSSADRRAAFEAALHGIANRLAQTEDYQGYGWAALAGGMPAPADMSGRRYATALNVQMEALVALLQAGPAPLEAVPGEAVEATLLRHEERYWERTLRADGDLKLPLPLMRRVVAAATLCGAADEEEAMAVASRVPGMGAAQHWQVAEFVGRLYPAAHDAFWGSLQPDRVAEYQASTTAIEVPGLLPALMLGAGPAQQVQAMTVLTRSVVAHANAGRARLRDAVLQQLGVLLDRQLFDTDVLRAGAAALPQSSSALARFAGSLTGRLVDRYRGTAGAEDGEDGLAWSLMERARRVGGLGDWRGALDAAEEALAICRRQAATHPEEYERLLVDGLIQLSSQQWEAGQGRASLALVEEAVALCRKLERSGPGTAREALAKALNSLAFSLDDITRWAEAGDAARESVAIRRRLAEQDASYLASYAESLRTLAVCQTDLGALEEGQATAEEALAIERRLAGENPDAYTASLARTLNRMSWHYWRAGMALQKTKAASEEAVALRRRLAADNPDTYNADLAHCLVNLAASQPDEESLETSFEARELYDRVDVAAPIRRKVDLRLLYRNRALTLWRMERREAAFGAIAEAVSFSRELHADNPAAHGRRLGDDLGTQTWFLEQAGRLQEALEAAEKELVVRRELVALHAAVHERDMARTLFDKARFLSDLGRTQEALDTAVESVEVYGRRWREAPDQMTWDYAEALALVSGLMAFLSLGDDPIPPRRRAVELLRTEVGRTPEAQERLASHLYELARLEYVAGGMPHLLRGLPPAREATEIYRQLAQGSASPPRTTLLDAARRWVLLLEACGRRSEAFDVRRRFGLAEA
ncbi:trypsin-like peptidase domain-containing protein [Streptomyces sp. NPDC005752]|uniref:trypsin-like peptidase domain-containing protein n=1 Tax=Streptomyces sp. NPDC005752 TaxID=3157065 RepID=UPI0033F89F0A